MASGILALIGKPKTSAPSGGSEREYASEAFSALKDDDEEGFITAFLGAVRACSKKADDDGYEADADDAEE